MCDLYPNQEETLRAQPPIKQALDHLSHLYPRPVGYPQREKGVPFSEPLEKPEEDQAVQAADVESIHTLCPKLFWVLSSIRDKVLKDYPKLFHIQVF